MGRKEKSVNASTAPTSTISKRPNTRQIGSSANSSTENEKMVSVTGKNISYSLLSPLINSSHTNTGE